MLWDKLAELCAKKGISVGQCMRDIGLTSSSATGWKKAEIVFFCAFLAAALVFLPLQSDVRLRELEAKKARLLEADIQIDSLLKAGAIDPKQADELKAKILEADIQIERFKLEQGMKE